MGVRVEVVMNAIVFGICPSLAPTKNSLEDANIPPFTEPKQEQATNTGIIQAIGPNKRLPNVYRRLIKYKLSLRIALKMQILKAPKTFFKVAIGYNHLPLQLHQMPKFQKE